MTTLKEQRMVAAHRLGMRCYLEGKPLYVPVYLLDQYEERDAFIAGYRGAERRAKQGGI